MGFDLTGRKPIQNTQKPDIIVKFEAENGFVMWEKMSENEKDDYFAAKAQWNNKNPGIYFRNTIWWWRPLWNYVSSVCDFNDDETSRGLYNDGTIIYKYEALNIAKILQEELDNGNILSYSNKYTEELDNLPLEPCEFCNGTGVRFWDDIEIAKDCNSCNTESSRKDGIPPGKVKNFSTSYPFSIENVESFIKFCKESGGFHIW